MRRLLFVGVIALVQCQQILGIDAPTEIEASAGALSCAPGRESCGGELCDTDITSDPLNCGACGWACSASNTPASCVAGKCALACATGFADCDSNPTNGCEVDTSSDPHNCGACGHDCAGGLCAVGVCQPRLIGDATSLPIQLVVTTQDVVFSHSDGTVGAMPLTGGLERPIINSGDPAFPVVALAYAGGELVTTSSNGTVWQVSANGESVGCLGQMDGGIYPGELATSGGAAWSVTTHGCMSCCVSSFPYHNDVWLTSLDAGFDAGCVPSTDITTPPFEADSGSPAVSLFYAHLTRPASSSDNGAFALRSDITWKKNQPGYQATTWTDRIVHVDPSGSYTPLSTLGGNSYYYWCPTTTLLAASQNNVYYTYGTFNVDVVPLGGCPDGGACGAVFYTGPVRALAVDDRVHICGITGNTDYTYCEMSTTNTTQTCDYTFDRIVTNGTQTCTFALTSTATYFAFGYSIYALAH